MPIDLMTSNLHPDGEALTRQFESARQIPPLGSVSASIFSTNRYVISAQAGSAVEGGNLGAINENVHRMHHFLVKCLKPDDGEAICTSETRCQVLRWRPLYKDSPLRSDPLDITQEKLQRDIGETQ